MARRFHFVCALLVLVVPVSARAQPSGVVTGVVRDESGAPLPGVLVELTLPSGAVQSAETDAEGTYRFEAPPPGEASLTWTLVNFAGARRAVTIPATGAAQVNVTLQLSLNADVTVTGKSTFVNLADVEEPTQSLIGVAQSASQGAITARQLDARPIRRTGEVLETVPGMVISQHSGEGKANQYYLRGFNLDHGTDFATTVAGMPVNMPTHGHGHGYSDLNFLMPELVSGVQFSKGPYFADQGDFATAGAANITYTNRLARPLVRVAGGGERYGRALAGASLDIGTGTLLAAVEVQTNDGPWDRPDNFNKVNGVIRFTRGDALNGVALTAMGYHGTWNSTDQIPARAVDEGLIGRFGTFDPTDGGHSYRYSGSVEWQRTHRNASTKVSAFGIAYDLDLFSNFTYYLDDPESGDQFQQADHRFVTGGRISHRRISHFAGRPTQNTVGLQIRNDDIGTVGLYHTLARQRIDTVREDSVLQTSVAGYAQNETAWTPWLRTLAGLRVDGYHFRVDANVPENSGTDTAGLVSPKGGATFGPWNGTEFYLNAGLGFHSNDARGSTISVDPATGEPADRVTPLARARGAEIGVRTIRIPHLQSSAALWSLSLDSELVFVGDAGTTEAGRPSHRYGVEWATYYSPYRWLTFDADLSMSQAHFTDDDPAGDHIPGAVDRVISAGATVIGYHRFYGSVRWRYFGPRALIEDDSVRSRATSLANVDAGYAIRPGIRLVLDVFNLFDARDSDIDYFYTSRLPGEPVDGVDDIHFHPVLPRTARVSLLIGF
ncbi:MAG TPA: TonB-dependent receptor [Vicinamibacterales bacterium]|nr:TonB-dependent receptor [Vicinamibacterales bacterium]